MSSQPRRALLVIDVQNEYVTGLLPIAWPPVHQALAAIGVAIDAARSHGLPVVVVQQDGPEGATPFAMGSPGWALHEVVASRPHDLLIHKTLPSAFADTGLLEWLRGHGVDTVSAVGFMTQNCVASTINHALHHGLQAEFLHDASGTLPYENAAGRVEAEEVHRVFSVVFESRFAAVTTTARWVEAVERRESLARDSVFASSQRGRGLRATSAQTVKVEARTPGWTHAAHVDVRASSQRVWALLSDVSTWRDWNEGVADIVLAGEFTAGNRFRMQLPDGDWLDSTLLRVEPERGFTDETRVGDDVVAGGPRDRSAGTRRGPRHLHDDGTRPWRERHRPHGDRRFCPGTRCAQVCCRALNRP